MGKNYKKDLIIFILLLVVTVIGMIYTTTLFMASFEDGEETRLSYDESSELVYKVWLKDNKFYSSEYLDEEYNAVSSSIKEIEIDFDYLLDISDYIQGSSYYTINSKIVAYQRGDSSERKIWDYEKQIKDKVITIYDTDSNVINHKDNFVIDYQMYKKLMDDYKSNYGVSLVGNLIIEIDIKTDLDYQEFENIIDLENRKMIVTIPLTETIVNITKNDIQENSQVLVEKGDSTINYLKLILSLIAFSIGIALCIYLGIILVKLIGIDSKYNKELKKILKTYGSVIVNVDELKLDDEHTYMKVANFYELLDAQQELKKPILFCNVKPNKKAIFAIKYDNDILVYKMNSTLYVNDVKKEASDKNG